MIAQFVVLELRLFSLFFATILFSNNFFAPSNQLYMLKNVVLSGPVKLFINQVCNHQCRKKGQLEFFSCIMKVKKSVETKNDEFNDATNETLI